MKLQTKSNNKKHLDNSKKSTFKRLFGLLWNANKYQLMLAIFLIVLAALGTLYIQIFIGKVIIGYLLNEGKETAHTFNYNNFHWIITGSVLFLLISILSSFIATRIMITITYKIMAKLRIDLYKHVQKLPVKFFDINLKGKLISNFTSDVDTLRQFLSKTFPIAFQSLTTLLVSIAVMFWLNWMLSLIMIGFILLILVCSIVISKFSRKFFRLKQKSIGDLNGYAEEMISGIKTIKIFNQQDNSTKAYS
ncbi:ABC transporter ATP-binding protein, partial [Mycoplasma nasistruthionis]